MLKTKDFTNEINTEHFFKDTYFKSIDFTFV